MRTYRLILAFSGLILVACGSWRLAGRANPVKTISILYTGDIDWTKLPELSNLIKAEEPALTIICGRVLDGGLITEQFKGQAEIEALARSGVNAVCVTPDFLRQGVRTARRLIDSVAPGVFFLSANLQDSLRQGPFGQVFVKAGRPGSKSGDRLAVIGLLTDSSSPDLRQPGLTWEDPVKAARKFLPQMKMNADLLGAALCPSRDLTLAGFDFAIGERAYEGDTMRHRVLSRRTAAPGTVYRLELQLDEQNQITGHHVTELKLESMEPDPAVQAIVQRYQQQLRTIMDIPPKGGR